MHIGNMNHLPLLQDILLQTITLRAPPLTASRVVSAVTDIV